MLLLANGVLCNSGILLGGIGAGPALAGQLCSAVNLLVAMLRLWLYVA